MIQEIYLTRCELHSEGLVAPGLQRASEHSARALVHGLHSNMHMSVRTKFTVKLASKALLFLSNVSTGCDPTRFPLSSFLFFCGRSSVPLVSEPSVKSRKTVAKESVRSSPVA
jgi:hypothetical protein